MSTSDTLVPLHHYTLLGRRALRVTVRLKKSFFGPFCLGRANSTVSMRLRLALYLRMLAGPSYSTVKLGSHSALLRAS